MLLRSHIAQVALGMAYAPATVVLSREAIGGDYRLLWGCAVYWVGEMGDGGSAGLLVNNGGCLRFVCGNIWENVGAGSTQKPWIF